MATHIHTHRHTNKGEWKQYCTSLVNKGKWKQYCTSLVKRRGNKTGKPKGDKSKGVKPPQRQGRALRSSHHFHFHRKFAYSIRTTKVGRASRSLSAAEDAFQCTSLSKSVASQKQRNFLETQRNFQSSKRSYPSSKSVACVFVHNC